MPLLFRRKEKRNDIIITIWSVKSTFFLLENENTKKFYAFHYELANLRKLLKIRAVRKRINHGLH